LCVNGDGTILMATLTQKQRTLVAKASQRAELGDLAGASEILRRVLKKNPANTDVLHQLALVHLRRGRNAEALSMLEQVTRLSPRFPTAFVHLALCHRENGAYDRAIQAVDEALALRSTLVEAMIVKAELLHMTGDYQGGYDLLAGSAGADAAHPKIVFEFARLAALLGRADEARAGFERLVTREDVDDDLRSDTLFELATLQERVGEFDNAWTTATRANDLQPDRFDPATHDRMIDAVIAAWTPQAIAALPRAGDPSEIPVFIVGMPRSGTSLVEQILASHPLVHGAGELPDIFQIVNRLQPHDGPTPAYIDDLSVLTRTAVDRSARTYLKALANQSRTAVRVTDKQVFNFLYLGAISTMFPDARVIHCVRDPRDVAVSCFFQSFMGRVYFANRLEHIGAFFAAYRRIMSHWTTVLNGPMLDVSYERLTTDQEAVSRELVRFVGLDWDDGCLRFHENPRTVETATIDQVRRPMYRSSVGRWRRYENQLAPIMAAFQV
jgi:tetratricopeptide (TPR) repeat protein